MVVRITIQIFAKTYEEKKQIHEQFHLCELLINIKLTIKVQSYAQETNEFCKYIRKSYHFKHKFELKRLFKINKTKKNSEYKKAVHNSKNALKSKKKVLKIISRLKSSNTGLQRMFRISTIYFRRIATKNNN